LKSELATTISDYFADFRRRKKELLDDPLELARILSEGSEKAREISHQTLQEVKQKIGLL
jgi:tryptophanyl-tRNA synthetase